MFWTDRTRDDVERDVHAVWPFGRIDVVECGGSASAAFYVSGYLKKGSEVSQPSVYYYPALKTYLRGGEVVDFPLPTRSYKSKKLYCVDSSVADPDGIDLKVDQYVAQYVEVKRGYVESLRTKSRQLPASTAVINAKPHDWVHCLNAFEVIDGLNAHLSKVLRYLALWFPHTIEFTPMSSDSASDTAPYYFTKNWVDCDNEYDLPGIVNDPHGFGANDVVDVEAIRLSYASLFKCSPCGS